MTIYNKIGRAKNGEHTVIKRLHNKYKNYFSLNFFYELYRNNNYVLNFVDTCEKIDKEIKAFEEEIKGYVKLTESGIDENVVNYIHFNCYPESTKKVQVIQTRISGRARWCWYVNLELFKKEKKLPMKKRGERVYKNPEIKTGNTKEEILWMLTFIEKNKKHIKVDFENETIDGYHLEYYRTEKAIKRIRLKELNIDLSDYIYSENINEKIGA